MKKKQHFHDITEQLLQALFEVNTFPESLIKRANIFFIVKALTTESVICRPASSEMHTWDHTLDDPEPEAAA